MTDGLHLPTRQWLQSWIAKIARSGIYHHYDAKVQAKIAKYACENGNKSAVTYFSHELGYSVSESAVRNTKKVHVYLQKLNSVPNPAEIVSLPQKALDRPLLVGNEIDTGIGGYIQATHLAGGKVNHSIVIAAAKEIIAHKRPALVKEHGGQLDVGTKWAESFLRRCGYVKC